MIIVVKKRNSKNGKLCNSFLAEENVRIVKFCGKHINCIPSAMNKNITAKRSGKYTLNCPPHVMYYLVLTMKTNNMRLSMSQIKEALRGFLL